jgi:hypothetical protein
VLDGGVLDVDYGRAVERIFEHLEEDNVDKALMGCLRIARHMKDYLSAAIFLRELYPNKKAVVDALYDDLQHLTKEAQKFVMERSLDAWIETRKLPLSMGNDDAEDENDRRNLLMTPVGELDNELQQWERAIADIAIPSGMGEFDTAAFADRYRQQKAEIRLRIKGLHIVRARIKANCLNYAIRIERQFKAQHQPQTFLDQVQTEVNNYFRAHCEDAYAKLLRAAQLVTSVNTEDASLLLTEVRRAMKSVADFFYPPAAGKVRCVDGQERQLGDEQYLNRIQEFLVSRVAKSSSRDLLEAEFSYLVALFRRLNDLTSKGVHGSVTAAEAKQGLLSFYLFLYNICFNLEASDGSKAPAVE